MQVRFGLASAGCCTRVREIERRDAGVVQHHTPALGQAPVYIGGQHRRRNEVRAGYPNVFFEQMNSQRKIKARGMLSVKI